MTILNSFLYPENALFRECLCWENVGYRCDEVFYYPVFNIVYLWIHGVLIMLMPFGPSDQERRRGFSYNDLTPEVCGTGQDDECVVGDSARDSDREI